MFADTGKFARLVAAVLAAALFGIVLWAGTAAAHPQRPAQPAPVQPQGAAGHGMMGHGMRHGMMGHGMMGHGMRHGMMGGRMWQSPQQTPPAAEAAPSTVPDSAPDSAENNVESTKSFETLLAAADPQRGRQLIVAGGCLGCHSLDENRTAVGPAWEDLAQTAATRVAGRDAPAYLYESIVHPNAFVVPGYRPNIMPQAYGAQFSAQELAAIVKYLLAQED